MVTKREIWEEARRRLAERYIKDNPALSWERAVNIASGRHEEIGAIMDAIEGAAR